MAATTFIPYDTNLFDDDQDVDALISGFAWDIDATNGVITYSFPTSSAQLGYSLGSTVFFSSGFSSTQQNVAEDAMGMAEDYTLIDFQEGSSSNATVRWFNATGPGIPTAFGYFPNTGDSGGDMAFNDGSFDSNLTSGTYENATFIHELGHALGLKHGHECCCSACGGGDGGAMPADQDSMEYSIMTYRSYEGHDLDELPFYTNADGSYAQTYMISDIAALQRMYGANYETESGNTRYTFDETTGEMYINGRGQGASTTNTVFRSVWDGDGVDTYDLSNYDTRLEIDLRPGEYSNFDRDGNFQRAELNFGIAPDPSSPGNYLFSSAYEEYSDGHLYNAYLYEGNEQSLIENAIGGTGNDRIHGNQVSNKLQGEMGRDKLFGYEADDILVGGNRKDRLVGGEGDDILKGGNGYDNLRGGKGADWLNGGKKDDMLTGGAGADTFVFKTDTANDTVTDFGTGDDVLDVSDFDFASAADVLVLGTQAGANVVFDLGDGVTITLEDVLLSSLTTGDFIV